MKVKVMYRKIIEAQKLQRELEALAVEILKRVVKFDQLYQNVPFVAVKDGMSVKFYKKDALFPCFITIPWSAFDSPDSYIIAANESSGATLGITYDRDVPLAAPLKDDTIKSQYDAVSYTAEELDELAANAAQFTAEAEALKMERIAQRFRQNERP